MTLLTDAKGGSARIADGLVGILGVEPTREVFITCSPEHFTRC
jgi:hypothetical protein